MGSLAIHVNLVFPKGKLSQRGVMWLAEDEMLSKWWTGDQNSCPLTPTLVLTYSGSLPLKTWLRDMHMKVAGCHALFMEVHVVVLSIWTYLCMRGKKNILYPLHVKLQLYLEVQGTSLLMFSLPHQTLCVCGLGLDLSNFRDISSFQVPCLYILTGGM